MRFNCGPSPKQKREAAEEKFRELRKQKEEWHKSFCWIPRRCHDTNDCVWLGSVERKGLWEHYWGEFDYRYRVAGSEWDDSGTFEDSSGSRWMNNPDKYT